MKIFAKKNTLIMIAGLAGGLAEIFWIALYSSMTHINGLEISRQITAAVTPAWTGLSLAPVLGIVIHLILSVILAFLCCTFFVEPLVRRFGSAGIISGSIAVLGGVWVINFFVVLPIFDPAFITLLPFLVTLASKLIFGWAMGTVLTCGFADLANRPAG